MPAVKLAIITSLMIVLSSCGSGLTSFGVRVFSHDQKQIIEIAESFTLNPSSSRSGPELTNYLNQTSDLTGVSVPAKSELALIGTVSDERGLSQRFTQIHGGLRVDGANLVAIAGPDGELNALNSSLVDVGFIDTKPTITAEEAGSLAFSHIQSVYNVTDALKVSASELLIAARENLAASLIWRLKVEAANGELLPVQVDVGAAGEETSRVLSVMDLVPHVASVSIYNAKFVPFAPTAANKGIKVLENGAETSDARRWRTFGQKLASPSAHAASKNLQATVDFFGENFSRKSYDGVSSNVQASVEVQRYRLFDIAGLRANAAWAPDSQLFIFGDGNEQLGGFAEALDVVAHEFTHAVIGSTSKLVYKSQSGALNEHLSDVFGELIEAQNGGSRTPFLIGETVLRGELAERAPALRDMRNPAEGLSKQPAHMDDVTDEFGPECRATASNDNCGVHILSGIVNRAAVSIIESLGRRQSYWLFYRVMTARLRPDSNFVDYRNQMLDECSKTLDNASCAAVREAFETVGL